MLLLLTNKWNQFIKDVCFLNYIWSFPNIKDFSTGINHNVDELLVGILTQLRLKRQKAEQEKSAKRQVEEDTDFLRDFSCIQVMDFLGKFIKLDMGKSCSNLNILW